MLVSRNSLHKATAELVGTFGLVFFGCGSIAVSERFSGSVPAGAVPLCFGLAVAAMIYAVGHISGAHFNPAVTLAFALARRFPMKHVFVYWVAQGLGALVASGALWALLPAGASYGATVPAVPVAQALAWEAILTFFLMFVIIAVATDTRAVGTMAGAAIGAAVLVGAAVGGPVTGASMNPARSFAPAVFQGEWTAFWIYVIGPMVGAAAAALLYEWIRCERPGSSTDAKGCC